MRSHRTVLAALLLAAAPLPRILVVSGSNPDNSATDLWLTILRRRLDPPAFDSVAKLRVPRTSEQAAWARLIDEHAATWPAAADSLAGLFPLPPLAEARVVVGNRGGEDAFTHDSATLAFDLSALQRVYGNADAPGNSDRLDRFFRHEFTHLLQKRWLARHPFTPRTPLESALLDMWSEGLGNYFSLGPEWRNVGGKSSPLTAQTLADLEPTLVGRLSALICADSAAARPLLRGLSNGPFAKKWGAVPVALYLMKEQMRDPGAMRAFAAAGPTAVWDVLRRHLPKAMADSVGVARQRAGRCPG